MYVMYDVCVYVRMCVYVCTCVYIFIRMYVYVRMPMCGGLFVVHIVCIVMCVYKVSAHGF